MGPDSERIARIPPHIPAELVWGQQLRLRIFTTRRCAKVMRPTCRPHLQWDAL
jgi:hypothetical protein